MRRSISDLEYFNLANFRIEFGLVFACEALTGLNSRGSTVRFPVMLLKQSAFATVLMTTAVSSFGLFLPTEGRAVELPEGTYLYLGPTPGQLEPKSFVIKQQGPVQWESTTTNSKALGSNTATEIRSASPSKHVVKLLPKGVAGSPSGIAQLAMKYEPAKLKLANGETRNALYTQTFGRMRYITLYEGVIRYKLTLLNVDIPKGNLGFFRKSVTLLDRDGFRLRDIEFFSFYSIPGTNLIESQSAENADENSFGKVKDYAVHE
ncbi:hypothetical protein KBI23_06365 [bacterium]|nr:hypothetical protein [bacterium]